MPGDALPRSLHVNLTGSSNDISPHPAPAAGGPRLHRRPGPNRSLARRACRARRRHRDRQRRHRDLWLCRPACQWPQHGGALDEGRHRGRQHPRLLRKKRRGLNHRHRRRQRQFGVRHQGQQEEGVRLPGQVRHQQSLRIHHRRRRQGVAD